MVFGLGFDLVCFLISVTWIGIQKQSVSIAKIPIALGREGTQKVTVAFALNCRDIGLFYIMLYIYMYMYKYIYINFSTYRV